MGGIATLLLHKVVSTTAFWVKEHDVKRCVLQLLDLLIFEEIYVTHNKVVAQFQSKTDHDQIETTSSFKYIRSLEAIFESIPQSVLQLVFIMRTGDGNTDLQVISLLSIFQS